MEENKDVLDIDSVEATGGPKRPAFITVLCILTFVGAGLGLIGALMNMFTVGQVEDTLNAFDRLGSGFSEDNDFTDFYRWTKISIYLNLLGNGLCLTGALMMWNLKKAGYFLYIPGQVIPFFGAVMVVSSMSGMMDGIAGTGGIFGMASTIGLVIGALFPIAFIVMYGVNLKHMK